MSDEDTIKLQSILAQIAAVQAERESLLDKIARIGNSSAAIFSRCQLTALTEETDSD
jgi:hypothetical protein